MRTSQTRKRKAPAYRNPELVVTDSAFPANDALRKFIDEAVVPAMVEKFLIQRGLIPATAEDNEKPLADDRSPTHNDGERL